MRLRVSHLKPSGPKSVFSNCLDMPLAWVDSKEVQQLQEEAGDSDTKPCANRHASQFSDCVKHEPHRDWRSRGRSTRKGSLQRFAEEEEEDYKRYFIYYGVTR